MSTPEGAVKAKVRKFLHDRGIYTFPINQGSIGRRGIPDDFAMLLDRPSFIEFKASMRWDINNKTAVATLPTPLQILEMEKARKAKMLTFVIDVNNAKDFMQSIENGSIYTHMWDMSLDTYMWYSKAPKEFFENHIKPLIVTRYQKEGYMPYETVEEMARDFHYSYSLRISELRNVHE